tara:strand:- start:1288 stop:1467 length:180 start_codon:yes stop_codon:yes gene_type:complete
VFLARISCRLVAIFIPDTAVTLLAQNSHTNVPINGLPAPDRVAHDGTNFEQVNWAARLE